MRDRGLGTLTVSRLCLGGNVFGWTADEDESHAVLDAYAEAGGTFIDTADAYSHWADGHSGGESETIIGRWLARRGHPEGIVVATKVGALPGRRGLRAPVVKAAAEESLRRLGLERIDLLYTHFDDESVEVAEIITALDDLVRAGKVREIGASNIAPDRLEASLAFSAAEGKAAYTALQPHYNLVSRDTYEGPLADVAARHGLGCVPYFGLAKGFLTGKYRPGTAPAESPRAARAAAYLDTPQGPRVLAALDEIAAAHGAAVATIALAWLATRPTVAAPIASARSPEQLAPLLAMQDLELSDEEIKLLTDASAPG